MENKLDEYLKRFEQFSERCKHDPELAKSVLIRAGIIDKKGKLTKYYR